MTIHVPGNLHACRPSTHVFRVTKCLVIGRGWGGGVFGSHVQKLLDQVVLQSSRPGSRRILPAGPEQRGRQGRRLRRRTVLPTLAPPALRLPPSQELSQRAARIPVGKT